MSKKKRHIHASSTVVCSCVATHHYYLYQVEPCLACPYASIIPQHMGNCHTSLSFRADQDTKKPTCIVFKHLPQQTTNNKKATVFVKHFTWERFIQQQRGQ
eukprot:scpid107317/ scgid29168/ 